MLRILPFFLLLCITFTCSAKIITGKVIKVADGDTITIFTNQSKKIKIRLAEIDAPEMAQPYGKVSQQALSQLVFSKVVLVEYKIKDKYGRIVGKVALNDRDICAEMVRNGHAWVYRHYYDGYYLYLLEYWARFNQYGLWALPDEERIPPWNWRQAKLSLMNGTN